eukprot:jgi/Botrbrau1/4044/Bobra.152_3s0005.1
MEPSGSCEGPPLDENDPAVQKMLSEMMKLGPEVPERLFKVWTQMQVSPWKARGGVPAALAAIPSGSRTEVIEAAQGLLLLSDHDHAAWQHAPKGTVQALLEAVDSPTLSNSEFVAVKYALYHVIHKCSSAAEQLVAAYTHPRPRIAFSALTCSWMFLEERASYQRMSEAGAASSLVALLSHQCLLCQSAAAVAIRCAAQVPAMRGELRDAGVVPAMMRVVREAPANASPDEFRGFEGLMSRDDSEVSPYLLDLRSAACTALEALIDREPGIAQEVAALSDTPATILQVLKQSSGDGFKAPAGLLSSLLQQLEDGRSFCRGLLAEGFPKIIARFLKPDNEPACGAAFACIHPVFAVMKEQGCPPTSTRPLFSALKQYICSGKEWLGPAASCLCIVGHTYRLDWMYFIQSMAWKDAEEMVEKLASKVGDDCLNEGMSAFIIIVECLRVLEDKAVLMRPLSVELVSRIFRMLRHGRSPAMRRRHDLPETEFLVRDGLNTVLQCSNQPAVIQALSCGLLVELKIAVREAHHNSHIFVLMAVLELLRYAEAVEQMRKAVVWPTLLVESAATCPTSAMRAYAEEWKDLVGRAPQFAAELLAAGAVDSLTVARGRVEWC